MPILGKVNNTLAHFRPYENEKFILEKQDIKGNYRNLVDESLDIKIHAKNCLSRYTP